MKRVRCPKCDQFIIFDETKYEAGQSLVFECPDERTLGEKFAFFEASCGISGYIQGVDPFDQPGVEAYKKNMFRLLGK